MKILLDRLLALNIPKLYATENQKDPVMVVRFTHPMSTWEWYISEFDGEELMFGFVCGHEGELGYVSLAELMENNCVFDAEFQPTPLETVKSDLRQRGLLR